MGSDTIIKTVTSLVPRPSYHPIFASQAFLPSNLCLPGLPTIQSLPTCTYMYVLAYMYMYVLAYMYMYVLAYMYMYVLTYMYVLAYMYIIVTFPRRNSMSPKGKCCSVWGMLDVTPSNPIPYLLPSPPILLHVKFKGLVAKQHPANVHTALHVLVHADM